MQEYADKIYIYLITVITVITVFIAYLYYIKDGKDAAQQQNSSTFFDAKKTIPVKVPSC